jgi:hypothetical protein
MNFRGFYKDHHSTLKQEKKKKGLKTIKKKNRKADK